MYNEELMKKKTRMILPKSRDGQFARLLGDLVGEEAVELTRKGSKDFYWPVPVAWGPKMYTYKGEFIAPIMGGTGFASLSDLISEATAGKQQNLIYTKVGALSVAGGVEVGKDIATGMPGAGFVPASIPGGTAATYTMAGAIAYATPSGTDTTHLTTITMTAQGNPALGILYDLLWCGGINTNALTTQSVSGTPTRYTGASSVGNFVFPAVRGPATALAATAHNHTVCTYTNQDGNAGTFPSHAGIASCTFNRIDLTNAAQWFMPLAGADTGIRAITQWQLSAAVATGQIDISLAQPLAFIPMPASGVPAVVDGINSAFNLKQILSGAHLNLMWIRPATGATSVNGLVTVVSG